MKNFFIHQCMRLGLQDEQAGSSMPLPDFVPAIRQDVLRRGAKWLFRCGTGDLLEISLKKVICDVVSLVKFPSAGRAVKAPLSDQK